MTVAFAHVYVSCLVMPSKLCFLDSQADQPFLYVQRGTILTYRSPSQISIVLKPSISLTTYTFASRQYEHKSCFVCGVAVCVVDTEVTDIGGENLVATNLRCLEDVEWDGIEIFKAHSSQLEPKYFVPE